MAALASSVAYLRTLRDIGDGHITLMVQVDRYDAWTGERNLDPQVVSVTTDRAPAAGLPDRTGGWWTPMVEAGHLALADGGDRCYYAITPAGRAWLADHARKDT